MTPPINGSRARSLATAILFLGLAVFAFWATRQSEAAWMGTPIPGDPGPYFLIRLCLWVLALAFGPAPPQLSSSWSLSACSPCRCPERRRGCYSIPLPGCFSAF